MNDMTTELVTINPADALTIFTTPNAMDPLLAKVRAAIDAFEPDTSTARGREAIASIAYKVARAKTYIDGEGKKLADVQKEIPKKIDATRKAIRDTLDAWKDEVRAPLTAWEKAEDARIAGHKQRLEAFVWRTDSGDIGSSAIRTAIENTEAIEIGPSWEEFAAEAAVAKDHALTAMRSALAAAEKREAEAAELSRLRAEAAAREQADREAKIAAEAADRARKEAEAKAAAEKKAAEDAAQREKAAAERRELELKLAAEQAERRAADAEAKAKRDAEAKAAAEAAEVARREADKAHRATINRAALSALVDAGIDDQTAKRVVEMIATKKVPHVHISY